MDKFTNLKDLTFMQFCAEVERAYKAGEIDLMEVIAISMQYQDALKNDK